MFQILAFTVETDLDVKLWTLKIQSYDRSKNVKKKLQIQKLCKIDSDLLICLIDLCAKKL